MFPLLYKYLMLHEQVCLPGVGRFYKHRKPSKLDFANKVFEAPVHEILFEEEAVSADRKFYAFLSREQGIDEVEAIRHFHEFAYDFKNHVTHHNETELPGFGWMKSSNGRLSFASADLLQNYFPATAALKVIRENAEHQILVGDQHRTSNEMQEMLDDGVATSQRKSRWWIAAVVLGIASIAAIVYYYYQHGSLRM